MTTEQVTAAKRKQERDIASGFQHEALIYEGADEFLAGALSFVEAALASGEPVLVAVTDSNAGRLETELGSAAAGVRFAVVEEVGRNPARLIPFWRDFLDAHGGGPVRVLSEPVWPGRGLAEIDECQRHESLVNVAFPQVGGLSLLCSYDASRLADEALGGVSHSHRVVVRDGIARRSEDYVTDPDGYAGNLTARPSNATSFEFDASGLGEVRRRVEGMAQSEGLDRRATADLVVAASELAANSVAHGGGAGTLHTWGEGDRLLVEIEDAGRIEEPLVGRLRPAITQEGGRGLWLANQLCDLVQIRSGRRGTTVRLLAAAA